MDDARRAAGLTLCDLDKAKQGYAQLVTKLKAQVCPTARPQTLDATGLEEDGEVLAQLGKLKALQSETEAAREEAERLLHRKRADAEPERKKTRTAADS